MLKKVRFDSNALDFFNEESKSKRKVHGEKLILLDNADNSPNTKLLKQFTRRGSKFYPVANNSLESIEYPNDRDKKLFSYLEMKKLDEGTDNFI